MRAAAVGLAAVIPLWLSACEERAPEEAVEQLRTSVEQADEAVDDLRGTQSRLAEDIREKRRTVRELMDKQITLIRMQIDAYATRVERLPAAAEQQLRPRLDDLRAHAAEAEALFQAYLDAGGEEVSRVREQLDAALDDLQSSLEQFEADVEAARAAA